MREISNISAEKYNNWVFFALLERRTLATLVRANNETIPGRISLWRKAAEYLIKHIHSLCSPSLRFVFDNNDSN